MSCVKRYPNLNNTYLLTPPPHKTQNTGLINVDFADVRSVMGNAGTALMGIGTGSGKTRAEDAATAAISSPLLDSPIDRATGIVFNIIGGRDMTLQEINAAAEVIYDSVDPNANIIFGALVDDTIDDDSISITVLATGFKLDEVSLYILFRRCGGWWWWRESPPPSTTQVIPHPKNLSQKAWTNFCFAIITMCADRRFGRQEQQQQLVWEKQERPGRGRRRGGR